MKLSAIVNLWDSEELLLGSMRCLKESVDLFVIVWQDVSNWGEKYDPTKTLPLFEINRDFNVFWHKFTPNLMNGGSGSTNERTKRNIGLEIAKAEGCTHFMHVDCDEYYQNFAEAHQMYIESGHRGSVVRLHTYFKLPTLRLEQDENYFVPFIHELRPDSECVKGFEYPFRVDPTRRVNEKDVVELPAFMEHYSYVRKDIGRKIRNSSAKKNLEISLHAKDYERDLKPGDTLNCNKGKLISVPDYFNINSML